MTLLPPQLALKRLVIRSRGLSVYDEKFRHGVNIIRGSNSSGKSTILDFIFYVLGGEIPQFKLAAERCEEVIAEVEMNGKAITIRRIVQIGGKQPMVIAYSDFETAMKSSVEGWQVFSMVRSASKESASQAMFRLLGFPEVKTDTDNSITMHQVLRLIYADQISAPNSLMRNELFDPYLIRETVGDLLFGVYDDLLFNELYTLREKKRALDAVKSQLDALNSVFGTAALDIDEASLSAQLEKLKSELKHVEDSLSGTVTHQVEQTLSDDIKQRVEQITTGYRDLKQLASDQSEQLEALGLELVDSGDFIEELKHRLASVEDSLSTRSFLGELPLTHCPQCLSELEKVEDPALCVLCGHELPKTPSDSRALKMKQELAQQLKESQQLYDGKLKAVAVLEAQIPETKTLLQLKHQQYEEAVRTVRPERDQKIDQLFVRKGELTAEIEGIAKQLKTAAMVKALEKTGAELQSLVSQLEMSIQRRKQTQLSRRAIARNAIEQKSIYILRKDLPRQEEFKVGTNIDINFGANTFALDGQNQFSASSVAYLKNAVHFGIFFASLEVDFFRYPRFILCDNIEDKGLEQDRSRNFQKIMVEMSEKSQTVHQIIFSTSMIDPTLNTDKYCVGPEYSVTRKSLDFSKLL